MSEQIFFHHLTLPGVLGGRTSAHFFTVGVKVFLSQCSFLVTACTVTTALACYYDKYYSLNRCKT